MINMPHRFEPRPPRRTTAQRLGDLFWIFFVASLALDVYSTCTMREGDFYAAAAMGMLAMLCFMAGSHDDE